MRPLSEQLREFQQRFSETPQHVIAAQINSLKGQFEEIAAKVCTEAAEALKDTFVFAAGRVGKPIAIPNLTTSRNYHFRYKFDLKRMINVTMYAVVEENEFVVGVAVDEGRDSILTRRRAYAGPWTDASSNALKPSFANCRATV